MQKKQWDAALTEIKKAPAVEKKTPFEAYQIDEFLGYVLIQQKKFAEAAPVFERMLNSGLMPADQVDERTKTVAQLYFQVKDYKKSATWAKKWLEKHPNNETCAPARSVALPVERLQGRRGHDDRRYQQRRKSGPHAGREPGPDRPELALQGRQQGWHRRRLEENGSLLPEARVLGQPARHLPS